MLEATPIHPGRFVKNRIIKNITDSKAAEMLDVGRPALNNFLNGKAALSVEMAGRISKVFNYPLEKLMALQMNYDAYFANLSRATLPLSSPIHPFLEIKANQIEDWAKRKLTARSGLAVLLRTLIHSTCKPIHIDFPGNDDSERHGSDGILETNDATPWLPLGLSIWEFGVSNKPKQKAERDFNAYLNTNTKKADKEATLVFVTPHRWKDKETWVKEKKALQVWKDIRVYDVNDLEQWLEQSHSAQAWLANQLGVTCQVRSLDEAWKKWAEITSTPLAKELFEQALNENYSSTKSYIEQYILPKQPNSNYEPFIIKANSSSEGLAFLATLFSGFADKVFENIERERQFTYESIRHLVIVFDKKEDFQKIIADKIGFIPVIYNEEVKEAYSAYQNKIPAFIIERINSTKEANVTVRSLSNESFRKALDSMGKSHEETEQLSLQTGRVLTVLRRKLAHQNLVSYPEWSKNSSLISFFLVGAWDCTNKADIALLEELSCKEYSETEDEFYELLQREDTPVWKEGDVQGVISKNDCFYLLQSKITSSHLNKFYDIALRVLGEQDPNLDLPSNERHMAAIYNKKRQYSSVLRKSIAETIVMLAHIGEVKPSNINCQDKANMLIKKLLPSPLTLELLQSSDDELRFYAEAAPYAFLEIIQTDLDSDNSMINQLLTAKDEGFIHDNIYRTGLIWGLETIAWNEHYFSDAIYILAKLAEIEISDGWSNTPENSLHSLFRAWFPQTCANSEQRVDMLKVLLKRNSVVTWKLCVKLLSGGLDSAMHNSRPQWRPYTVQKLLHSDIQSHLFDVAELLLNLQSYTANQLSDLISILYNLPKNLQKRIWDIIVSTAENGITEADKSMLREQIRLKVLSRFVKNKTGEGFAKLSENAKEVLKKLEATDSIEKNVWLFKEAWIQESADELTDMDFNYEEREARVKKLRIEALNEIYNQYDLEGILKLSERGQNYELVGFIAASTFEQKTLINLAKNILEAANSKDNSQAILLKGLLMGLLFKSIDNFGNMLDYFQTNEQEFYLKLLQAAPFTQAVWLKIDELDENTQADYWREVQPNSPIYQPELTDGAKRLLKAERPKAAFNFVSFRVGLIEDTNLVFDLLSSLGRANPEQDSDYKIDSYNITEAFKIITKDKSIPLMKKAILEFQYLEILDRSYEDDSNIPSLEKFIEESPDFFVQAVVWCWKRDDGTSDNENPELDADRAAFLAKNSYSLFEAIKRIPFADVDNASDKLKQWVENVREACQKQGRLKMSDSSIGKIFGRSPTGKDEIWPCEPVRDVLEEIRSKEMIESVRISKQNSRGVVSKSWDEGGHQEQALSNRYNSWHAKLKITHPFVASNLYGHLKETYQYEAKREDNRSSIRKRLSK